MQGIHECLQVTHKLRVTTAICGAALVNFMHLLLFSCCFFPAINCEQPTATAHQLVGDYRLSPVTCVCFVVSKPV